MKKHFLAGTIFALIFLIAGCDLSGNTFSLPLSTEPVPDEGKGLNIYLVKVNGNTRIINGSNTGYVRATRNVITEEAMEDESSLSDFTLPDDIYNMPSYFDEYNTQTVRKYLKNDARENETPNTREQQANSATEGEIRTFNVATSEKGYDDLDAVCKYTNNFCNVWYIDSNKSYTFENNYSGLESVLLASKFKEIGDKFATFVQAEEQLCGSHTYTTSRYANIINPVDKIDIIIFDIFGDAKSTQTGGTFGYFFSRDMLTKLTATGSNETQCIYIDSFFLCNPRSTPMVYSTLVHEYNHLLNFVNKTVIQGLQYDTWYTEMLSMVCEDIFQKCLNIDDKYGPKGRFPYFVKYANYGFKKWLDGDKVLISYANDYIFGAYLGRNYGGPELIHKIATNAFVGEQSITKAIQEMGFADDFYTALENEFIIMFNTEQDDVYENLAAQRPNKYGNLVDRSNFFTLNNSSDVVWETNSKARFTSLDISTKYVNDQQTAYVNELEDYYHTSALEPYSVRTLYPYGFDINMITDYLNPVDYVDLYYNSALYTNDGKCGYLWYWSAK
jgi:hypothetical protein